jgi:hypothetical protein
MRLRLECKQYFISINSIAELSASTKRQSNCNTSIHGLHCFPLNSMSAKNVFCVCLYDFNGETESKMLALNLIQKLSSCTSTILIINNRKAELVSAIHGYLLGNQVIGENIT